MKYALLVLLTLFSIVSSGQIPAGYYDPANGLTGLQLKQALHNIIDDHNEQSYSSLLTHFQVTDAKPNGKVWDIYSDRPDSIPPYEYDFGMNCGSYNSEMDCYNREHTWPQSWFNSDAPMQSDMFHVYPTDGYVNGRRGNDPFSEVDNPTWVSMNGGKSGPSSFTGYTGNSFEPIDAYKGDIARSYFYMSVRYYTEDSIWLTTDMVTKSEIKQWAVNVLMKWSEEDPVSQKEIDRNNAIYQIQNNRNPFIDHPEYITEIWTSTIGINETERSYSLKLYPNPSTGKLYIENKGMEYSYSIFDLTGRAMKNGVTQENYIHTDLNAGAYLVKIKLNDNQFIQKIIIQ